MYVFKCVVLESQCRGGAVYLIYYNWIYVSNAINSVFYIFKLSEIAILYFCPAKIEIVQKSPIGDFKVAKLATFQLHIQTWQAKIQEN